MRPPTTLGAKGVKSSRELARITPLCTQTLRYSVPIHEILHIFLRPSQILHPAEGIHTATQYQRLKQLLRLTVGVLPLMDCQIDKTRSSNQLHYLLNAPMIHSIWRFFMLTRSVGLSFGFYIYKQYTYEHLWLSPRINFRRALFIPYFGYCDNCKTDGSENVPSSRPH
jgi:hypothetical protein